MIRSLYPDLAKRVQDAIAREGKFMLPDVALIEHVLDIIEEQIDVCVAEEAKRLDAQRDAELLPHDATPVGASAVVEPVAAAPIAATDETAHESPAG